MIEYGRNDTDTDAWQDQDGAVYPGTDPQNPQNLGAAPPAGGSEGFEGLPHPLPGRTRPLPTEALGSTLRPLVETIADRLQVPTDLVVNLALPIATTAAKGGWIVQVQPGWTEPLCLATLSALASGERKSPTLRLLDAPLRRIEKEHQDNKRPEIARQVARRKLAESRVEELRKQAIRAKAHEIDQAEGQYLDEVDRLESLGVDSLPRWLADDATPEKFVSLLGEHGAIGAVSAEPGLFGLLAGRYSNGVPAIEWFLQATSGETIVVDRIGRDADRVEAPALSIACCIQPGRLVDLGRVKTFRESGLLARWLYALPESRVGGRAHPQPIPPELLDAWDASLSALAEAGAKRRSTGRPATLPLAPDAAAAILEFGGRIEPHLHPEHGRYAGIADWMAKLAGSTVRIAGILTLLDDPAATEVDVARVAAAIELAKAYIGHALAAFGLTRPGSERYTQAKQVLACLLNLAAAGSRTIVSRREVHQKLRDRSWVETAESLAPALQLLHDYGHIRTVPHPEGQPGRPSVQYEINPAHFDPQNPRTSTDPRRTA